MHTYIHTHIHITWLPSAGKLRVERLAHQYAIPTGSISKARQTASVSIHASSGRRRLSGASSEQKIYRERARRRNKASGWWRARRGCATTEDPTAACAGASEWCWASEAASTAYLLAKLAGDLGCVGLPQFYYCCKWSQTALLARPQPQLPGVAELAALHMHPTLHDGARSGASYPGKDRLAQFFHSITMHVSHPVTVSKPDSAVRQ